MEQSGSSDAQTPSVGELPAGVRSFFWDCDFQTVDPAAQREFVLSRLVERGDWDSLVWLRQTVGDEEIRRWLLEKGWRRLNPRHLRFWALILGVPEADRDDLVRRSRGPWAVGRPGR